MNSTKNIFFKKIMTVLGVLWLVYLFFHMFSLLTFYNGEYAFNSFYNWFNNLFIYNFIVFILFAFLIFHVCVAAFRQFKNNKSKGINSFKSYDKDIPRIIVWGSVLSLLAFIFFHFIQMKLFNSDDIYQQMLNIFKQPIMLLIYFIGLLTLSAHLYHALTNVLQTLGISSKQYKLLVIFLILTLVVGFISIPFSIYVKQL
jgi:succinate dehydrogenase / fumarate reductase cytochrome b subunit